MYDTEGRAACESGCMKNEVDSILLDNKVYWCVKCEAPVLSSPCPGCGRKADYVGNNLKPSFATERRFLGTLLGADLPEDVLIGPGRVYWNGNVVAKFHLDANTNWVGSVDIDSLKTWRDHPKTTFWDRALCANEPILLGLEAEAQQFISQMVEKCNGRLRVVSLSGGKDSAIVGHIATATLRNVQAFHCDTTLEFPHTAKYLREFCSRYDLKLHTRRTDQDFFSLCRDLDPPSRIMRWCCSVLKVYPLALFLNDVGQLVLNFDGIRRFESMNRSLYPRVATAAKNPTMITARPIFNWPTFACWLYARYRSIPLNPEYDKGYRRLGCYFCPSSSGYEDFITRAFYPKLWAKAERMLMEFARRTEVKDKHLWVRGGLWKKRRPRKETDYVVTCSTVPYCLDDWINIDLRFSEPLHEGLLDFLRPLGKMAAGEIAGELLFQVAKPNEFRILGSLQWRHVRASFSGSNAAINQRRLLRQIRKYLNCVGCGTCTSACPHGAISTDGKQMRIDIEKCTTCGACIDPKYIKEGCVALSYTSRRKSIRRCNASRP